MKKYALIGTSCSGKTTLAYSICGELKQRGIEVDGVFQQDRRMPFNFEYLEETVDAQYWVVLSQMLSELEFNIIESPDVLISDRSVLDFYAYLIHDFEDEFGLVDLIRSWIETYDKLYYLEPLPYVEEGRLPDDEFRLEVDNILVDLIDSNEAFSDKVEMIPRENVCEDIFADISQRESSFYEIDVSLIPEVLGEDEVAIAGSYGDGLWLSGSDFDVFVCNDSKIEIGSQEEKLLERVINANFDVTLLSEEIYTQKKQQPDVTIVSR